MKNFYKSGLWLLGMLVSALVFAQDYSSGVFILNEGGIGSGNASLSFLNLEGELENNVYENVNSQGLGDTAQGLGINDNRVYIVLNYSNTVVVADQFSMENIAVISEGIQSPRYIAFHEGKGYVTCWGDPSDPEASYVAVIDLLTNEVISTIPVAEGPERILEHGGKLYVAHQGGYGQGKTVSVINAETEELVSVEVGDVPNSMVLLEDSLYVLCGGIPSWTGNPTDGTLYKLNLETNEAELVLDFEAEGPAFLSYDEGQYFYYVNGAQIFRMETNSVSVPETHFIQTPIEGWGGAYGFSVIDGVIYVADAGDYTSPGTVYTYTADTGEVIETYTVGVIPNGFYKSEHIDLGVSDLLASQVQIYPNPASGIFYIDSKEASKVEIYDLTGRIVKSVSNYSNGISVRELSKGIYLVKIQVNHQIITKKLIIK